MNKKIKRHYWFSYNVLLSISPIIIRLYATDYDGIISKPNWRFGDSKMFVIGSETFLGWHTMDWCCISLFVQQ